MPLDNNDVDPDADLSLSDLRTFLRVMELGSQQAAADSLNITQGTVSRRLARVQKLFGEPLFEDGPVRPLELSGAGAQVAQRVREALELLRPLPAALAKCRPLCIAFSGSVRAILVEALNQTPELACCLRETTGAEFRQLFARGQIDAALSFDLNTDRSEHSDVKMRFVGAQKLALVLPADRAHLQGESVSRLVQGLQRSYISRSLLPRYNDEIKQWLARHDVPGDEGPEGEARTASELFARVERGSYYGFLPKLCASVAGKGVAFVKADGIDYSSRLHFYVHGELLAHFDLLFDNLRKVCASYDPG